MSVVVVGILLVLSSVAACAEPQGTVTDRDFDEAYEAFQEEYHALRRIEAERDSTRASTKGAAMREASERVRNVYRQLDADFGRQAVAVGRRDLWCEWRRIKLGMFLSNGRLWKPGFSVTTDRPVSLNLLGAAVTLPFTASCPEGGDMQARLRFAKGTYRLDEISCSLHESPSAASTPTRSPSSR